METVSQRILTVDIGGSHIKATILDEQGKMVEDYQRMVTPVPSTPDKVIETIKNLAKNFSAYNKISVGFPGYVKNGIVITAPNLGTSYWVNFPLAQKLSDDLDRPVHVVNDADLQGIGVASGKGFEMVITLGTGFGTSLLMDGTLLPHLELAHHPVANDLTYDEYIGEKTLEKIGKKKWNKRMQKVFVILKTVFNYDHLYISGGNASLLKLESTDKITIVGNKDGIRGGAKLWLQKSLKITGITPAS